MFDLRRIPVLRVLIPFFGGIISGNLVLTSIQTGTVLFVLLPLWGLAMLFFFWQGRRPGSGTWFLSTCLFLLFYLVGLAVFSLKRQVDPDLPLNQEVLIRGELCETPYPAKYAYSFDMELHMLFTADSAYRIITKLKGHISMPADSVLPKAGEIWQFYGRLVPMRTSGNPGAPDFRLIMGRKNCWYHFYPSSDPNACKSNRRVAEGRRISPALIRRKVSGHWHGAAEDVALLKAVCLGDRSTLSEELRQSYASAGGMHLLAVSGLHVGLIWWVLQYMTGWIRMIFKEEKQRSVLVLGFLWFYAFLTGFSSSVCRSVTMFSFFSVSRMMGQGAHPLNGILVSAFFLVYLEPLRLMEVGFQLSYAAIIGIVSLYPLFRKLLRTKNRLLRRVWEASSVSMAAQLSTAPLVVFYFHQLPLYSILTSLVAIPLLSVLIAIFVISVPFTSANVMENVFNFILVKLAQLMNGFMEYIASLPGAVMDGLLIDTSTLFFYLLLLLLLLIFLHGRQRLSCYLFMICLAGLLILNSLSFLERRSSSELVISHFKGASMVIIRDGSRVDQYCWYRDSSSIEYMEQYREATWSKRIYKKQLYEPGEQQLVRGCVSAAQKLGDGSWLLGGRDFRGLVFTKGLQSSGQEAVFGSLVSDTCQRPDFILLSGEPPQSVLPDKSYMGNIDIVIDGSNRKWYIDRMMRDEDSIYITDRSGAFVKRW
jgi:competence protein ComEC